MTWYEHDEPRKEKAYAPHAVNTDDKHYRVYNQDDESACATYVRKRGLSWDVAQLNAWKPVERKGLRVYIPAITRVKGHVYWQARGVIGQELRYESPKGPRRDALVVVHHDPRVRSVLGCVVEGPFDALAVAEIPGVSGIALMGIKPPKEALDFLCEHVLDYQRVVCVADSDQIHGMMSIQNLLATRGIYSDIKTLGVGNDVADLPLAQRKELLHEHDRHAKRDVRAATVTTHWKCHL